MPANKPAPRRGRPPAPPPESDQLPPDLPDSDAAGAGGDVLEMPLMDEETRIEQILAEEGANQGTWEVHHKDKMGRWCFCTGVASDEWSTQVKQAIAIKFGPGDYRVRLRRGSGDARGTFGGGFMFRIDEAATRPEAEAALPSGLKPAPAAPTGGDRFAELFLQMQQQANESRREFVQMMQANQATMVTLLTTFITQKPVPPSEKMIEVLAERALKPDNQLSTLITALVQLKRVAQEQLGPRSDQPPRRDFFETLIDALPGVLELLNRVTQPPAAGGVSPSIAADLARPVGPAAARPAQPVAVAAAEAPLVVTPAAPPAQAKPPEDPKLAQLKVVLLQLLPALCQAADAGSDPVAVGDQVADQLEDQGLVALQEFLQRPDWLAILIDTYEPAMARSVWLTNLRNAVLDIEVDQAPAAEAAPPAPGGIVPGGSAAGAPAAPAS